MTVKFSAGFNFNVHPRLTDNVSILYNLDGQLPVGFMSIIDMCWSKYQLTYTIVSTYRSVGSMVDSIKLMVTYMQA